MVVLDEVVLCGDARIGVPLASVGLREETPLVAVDRGLEDGKTVESSGERSHGAEGSHRSSSVMSADSDGPLPLTG